MKLVIRESLQVFHPTQLGQIKMIISIPHFIGNTFGSMYALMEWNFLNFYFIKAKVTTKKAPRNSALSSLVYSPYAKVP